MPEAEPLVLALDVGTSSARALVFDRCGRAAPGAEARQTYEVHTLPGGGAELDAGELFDCVARLLDAVAHIPAQAVALCTFWHSMVGVDREGKASTPLYTWADTRASAAAEQLTRRLDASRVHARTGCVLHPSYLPARLEWLGNSKVHRWVSPGEYIHLRLFGRATCSISMASGTGLFHQNEKRWDEEMLQALGLDPEQLSPISDAPLAGLRGEFARRWPGLAKLPWFPAYGDGACSNIGSGCTSPERIALMVGTSGALRVVWEKERVTPVPGLWCYRVDARRFVVGGALSTGGELYAWCRQTLALPPPEEVERQLAPMPPDGHGLTVLPFLSGERSPGWAGNARMAIRGLNRHTQPVDILRAGLEAVAYRFALVRELLRGLAAQGLPPAQEIVATGRALLASPTWTQMMADVLGEPVVASAEPEASARGAALLALEALGALRSLDEAPAARPGGERIYVPDLARHEVYVRAMERQKQLYDLLLAGGGKI